MFCVLLVVDGGGFEWFCGLWVLCFDCWYGVCLFAGLWVSAVAL